MHCIVVFHSKILWEAPFSMPWARAVLWATPRQLDVPRSADIICKVCLQDL
eukprot:COSAG06_NODE_36025_length_452_cov_2.464589_1_plen_50_part_10